jgi:hypothetical protein
MRNFRAVRRVALLVALLGLAFSAQGGPRLRPRNWMFLGPAPIFDSSTRFSGRIDVAVPDPLNPNVMYVGGSGGGGTTGGGIWKTSNWLSDTPTWKPLIDHLPSLSIFAKSLALFPGPHGGIVYAAAQGPNGGILRSRDGGAHWRYLAQNLFGSALFGAIAVSPANSNRVYAAVGGNVVHGLYQSINGGATWTNITNNSIGLGAASDVVIDPANPSILYTGILNGSAPGATHGGVYQSSDGGQSWTAMNLPLPDKFKIGNFIALRMAPSNPNYVYGTVFGANNSESNPELQRFRTIDAGASWQLLTLPHAVVPKNMCHTTDPANTLQDFRFWHVVLGVDPSNPDVVYANACEPTFVVSQTGGMSWTQMPTVDDVVNAFFDDAGDLALVGDRGIHLSSNPLSKSPTFASKQGNLGNFLIHTLELDPLNPAIIYAVSQDQLSGIQYTGNTTWSYLPAGSEVGRFRVNPTNDDLVYTWGFQDSIFFKRSENGGQTWAPQMQGLDASDFEAEDQQSPFNAFVLDPGDSSRLVLGGQHVWEAIDEGPSQPLTWSMLATAPSPGDQITALAVMPGTNGETVYAGTEGNQFLVTTNGGATGATSRRSRPTPLLRPPLSLSIRKIPNWRLSIRRTNRPAPGISAAPQRRPTGRFG